MTNVREVLKDIENLVERSLSDQNVNEGEAVLKPSQPLFGTSANPADSEVSSSSMVSTSLDASNPELELLILCQPDQFCQFVEGTTDDTKPIGDAAQAKRFVTVKVQNCTEDCWVIASPVACDSNGNILSSSNDEKSAHKCQLVGNCRVPVRADGTALFSDLRVHRNADGPSIIRISFQAICDSLNGQTPKTSKMVFSEPIYDSGGKECMNIKILEMDKNSCTVHGGEKLWIRCSSRVDLTLGTIDLTFSHILSGWKTVVHLSPSEVYGQFIICPIPPFNDDDIDEPVVVEITIANTGSGFVSPPVPFTYTTARLTDKPSAFSTNLAPMDHPITKSILDSLAGTDNGGEDAASGGGGGPQRRLNKAMTDLWLTHLNALWEFGSEGDPQALVTACRHLIGWQNEDDGNSVLHVAVRNKQAFALKTLLNAIADAAPADRAAVVNRRNARRQTPLQCAVRYGDADSVHYLIAAGAERTPIDGDGNTVAHYLADTYNEAIYKDILFPPHDTVAAKQTLDLSLRNVEGVTPLLLATKRLKLALIEDLLEAASPLDVQCRVSGNTALHVAAQYGDIDIVDSLLQRGASLSVQSTDGATPLHWAALNGDEIIAARMIEHHSDPDAKTALWKPNVVSGSAVVSAEPVQCSPRDVAAGNERLLSIFDGQKPESLSRRQRQLVTVVHEPRFRPVVSHQNHHSPYSGENGRATTTSSAGNHSRLSARRDDGDGGPSEERDNNDGDDEEELGAVGGAPRPQRRRYAPSEGTPELMATAGKFKDDMSTIDFVTRLRLSKLMDEDGRWQRLASILGCEHMVEFLTVCTDAEEESSPTIMLLDQYEQMPSASVTTLVKGLESIGEEFAAELVSKSRRPTKALTGEDAPPSTTNTEQ